MSVMDLEPLEKLSRDLRGAAAEMDPGQARVLVDLYYQMQEFRKASANQTRAMAEEPHATVGFFADQFMVLEKQVGGALDKYSAAQPLGQWARGIIGIGPVIAAGLLCHIDMHKAPTVGHIWRFAGLDPTQEWGKGEKRPWNAQLKTLCWKIGESFVKVSGNDNSYYGRVYVERKAFEVERDLAGYNAPAAEAKLAKFKIGKDTEAYKAYSTGHLPAAHLHARAKRYAVKLFLSHYHHEGHVLTFGTEPPLPYPIAHLGHVHYKSPSEAT